MVVGHSGVEAFVLLSMCNEIICRVGLCGFVVVVYSYIVLYIFFVDTFVISLFVSCIVGSFGGWCCRRLIVVLVEFSNVGPDGNARSVGGGLFAVGGDAGFCAGRVVHWVVGRVVYVSECGRLESG